MKKIGIKFLIFSILISTSCDNNSLITDNKEKPPQSNNEIVNDNLDLSSEEFNLTEDDCFEFEEFDPNEKSCYFECETDQECNELDNKLAERLESLENTFNENKPFKEEKPRNDQAKITYDVKSGKISNMQKSSFESSDVPEILTNQNIHNEIWNLYSKISLPSLLNKVEKYELFFQPESGTVAYVTNTEGTSKWLLGINLGGIISENDQNKLDSPTLKHTLIHESAHILSLNDSQVNFDSFPEECQSYFIDEGCSNKNAYINNFFDNYWKNKITENKKNESIEDITKKEIAFNNFYNKYKNEFVTSYAATNPVEDFAESYTKFIIRNKPQENNISDQKINFFYQFNELNKFRAQIRRKVVLKKEDFQIQAKK